MKRRLVCFAVVLALLLAGCRDLDDYDTDSLDSRLSRVEVTVDAQSGALNGLSQQIEDLTELLKALTAQVESLTESVRSAASAVR